MGEKGQDAEDDRVNGVVRFYLANMVVYLWIGSKLKVMIDKAWLSSKQDELETTEIQICELGSRLKVDNGTLPVLAR